MNGSVFVIPRIPPIQGGNLLIFKSRVACFHGSILLFFELTLSFFLFLLFLCQFLLAFLK